MRALKDRARTLALVLCGALAMAAYIGFGAEAQTSSPLKATAAKCPSYSPGGPCKGNLMSAYSYEGEGVQATRLLKAKFGPRKLVGTRFETLPFPGQWQVYKRTVSWTSVSGVKIVAVYEVHEVKRRFIYHKLSSSTHSGHHTLIAVRGQDPPVLVMFGEH